MCGLDSIDDANLLRAGGTSRVFDEVYAPSTVGIFLREFTFGHANQLAAVGRAHLVALAQRVPLLPGIGERAFVDIDSLLRPVYGHHKQGASFGHAKIASGALLRRAFPRQITTLSTAQAPPVIAEALLRSSKAGSGRGAKQRVGAGVRRCGSRPALPKGQVSGPVITPGRGRWAASVDLRAGSQELITVHDRVGAPVGGCTGRWVHRSVGHWHDRHHSPAPFSSLVQTMTAGVIVAILAILGIDPLVGVFGSMAGVATVGMVPLMLTNFTLVTGGSTVLAAIPFAGLLVGACCGGRHNRCRIPGPAEIRHPATRMLRGSRLRLKAFW